MTLRQYSSVLTADVNRKGVLDVDVVKGCEIGMAANAPNGCYGACYAAAIAKFRGFDFTTSVVRVVDGYSHALSIVRAVKNAPYGFFRVGTMGDPCHAWEETCETIEWLAPYATPVVVTKHWVTATDEQLARLLKAGAIINTSISALDTNAQRKHRLKQLDRYAAIGGCSVARVVSCKFSRASETGRRLAKIQDSLLSLRPIIDNPLRIPVGHDLAKFGVVELVRVMDINTVKTVSLENESTYLGHCSQCADRCGQAFLGERHCKPSSRQGELFELPRGTIH